ncbi:alpha/beta fold hydrolase [Pseudalkalibacillus hwajinpoensis]|uniref:Alpha/beta hydrolase n=1 Tax=Guptibacillus hwajinpoensis TaxID=208199 RepID=A0A4V5PYT2_9BACL|nr:alpha/beta hydrolase [Pseudalkalibacillus hwajinpoensis]TKD71238.1 alpha/beta hydrolase [Pseudalkalibacillus hwajinpoensis]
MSKETFIQVSDFKLFTKLIGKKNGKQTVVLEAGYGDYSKGWNSIVSEIASLTEVLVYDRAGLGKSEESSNPRTSLEMVKELKELLDKMSITPPYLLVGHSFGGVNARLYASIYPEDVSGLILVDSTPEDYRVRFLPTMSEEFQKAYNKQFNVESDYDEFGESLNQLKKCKVRLSVPLIVLSAGKKDHYSDESQNLWNQLQEEILQYSSKSELLIAENSAHYIQDDEPSVVIGAIKRLLEK